MLFQNIMMTLFICNCGLVGGTLTKKHGGLGGLYVFMLCLEWNGME